MTVVVAVLGGRRGAGRTTLAANLAVLAAQEGLDVALVDADPRTAGAAAWWARRRAAPASAGLGLRFLPCPPGRLRELAACAGAFGADLVVADGPAEGAPGLAAAARACDLAVVPVGPEGPGTGREAQARLGPVMAGWARRAKGGGGRAAVAAVAVRHALLPGPVDPFGGALPGFDAARAPVEALGARLCPAPLRARPDFARAAARGLAAAEFRPFHLAAAEAHAVWGWLRARLAGVEAAAGAAGGRAAGPGMPVAFWRPRADEPPPPPAGGAPGGGGAEPVLRLAPEAAEALVALASSLRVPCLDLLHDAVEGLAAAHGHRARWQRSADVAAAGAPGGPAMGPVDRAATALRDGFAALADELGAPAASRAAAVAACGGALLARFSAEGRPAAAVVLAQHMGGLGRREAWQALAGGALRALHEAPWLALDGADPAPAPGPDAGRAESGSAGRAGKRERAGAA